MHTVYPFFAWYTPAPMTASWRRGILCGMNAWHALNAEEVERHFSVDAKHGLSKEEAARRLTQFGRNAVRSQERYSGAALFLKQLKSPLVVILELAFGVTLYLGQTVDATVIAVAFLVNIGIGFVQEFRAERAFDTLAASQEHTATLVRGGGQTVIPALDVVPGDIIISEAGSIIPADARIISVNGFSVSEAHLTGESAPVEKSAETLPEDTAVYKRRNMVFMGSPVTQGVARALVVATGGQTQIGAIAASVLSTRKEKTPVEKSIQSLARFISILILVIIAALFVFGFLRGMALKDILLLSVALAVSVVPEGLPAAVTAILAIGMERILRQKGFVRNLLAAETLGSTTVILTDKTGTLTEARMHLSHIISDGDGERHFDPYATAESQALVLKNALRVSNAFLDAETNDAQGNPVERAIVRAADQAGIYHEVFEEREEARVDFLAFESGRRFAAALYRHEDGGMVYFTGAPELLLEKANRIMERGKHVRLSAAHRERIRDTVFEYAREGKRVVASSFRATDEESISRTDEASDALEKTVFAGLMVFSDPVRMDVAASITEVQEAGVRVVMVTGDTPETALAIATEAGVTHSGEAITGADIEHISDTALLEKLKTVSVFARVLPHQKRRLVRVLQDEREVVAMTGDGVNDAPALKAAAIGIALGAGTAVARESSDLVLLDNSFSIIVAAIHEGRRIMDNLKKAVTHLVTTSFHEVFLVGFSVIAGMPLPILPIQILWVNILEEGFLTFGFAFEPGEKDLMKQNPRSERMRTILTKEIKRLILTAGIITGVFSTGLFVWLLSRGVPIEEIRTIVFVMLSLDGLLFALSIKQLRAPLWKMPLFNNPYLLFALMFSFGGIAVTLFAPPLRNLLSLAVPNAFDFAVLTGVALVNIITIEGAKKLAFSRDGRMAA